MAMSKSLKYGSVEIYHDEDKILGVGAYGKVCLAKYGQLPCAAKLLHDTMFEGGDPGRFKFAERFEQECQFLSMIKHPNIVQCLGISTDSQSRRLALLMELMDESLTKFLERSPGPLPYHTQINICYDVALALSYLHSNAIVHRDLSSNNVLLIGEGSRAKVTDFGMSKLLDINPRLTPLTLCPGATVYMPPEALITPPHYTSKLDCFSHGVLTIQIVTRQFPKPGDAHKSIEDPNYPTRRLILQLPESERRKNHIDLIKPDYPLYPIALDCLNDRDTDRPLADEICERLASLKREGGYASSLQGSNQVSLLQTLQDQLREKDCLLQKERKDHQIELERERNNYQSVLRKEKENYLIDLEREKDKYQSMLQKEKESHQIELRKQKENHQSVLKEEKNRQIELQREIDNHRAILERERASFQVELQRERADHDKEMKKKEEIMEQILEDCQHQFQTKVEILLSEKSQVQKETIPNILSRAVSKVLPSTARKVRTSSSYPLTKNEQDKTASHEVSTKLTWNRLTKSAPQDFTMLKGRAVSNGSIAYFSTTRDIYSFILPNKWNKLPSCGYQDFGLAVIHDRLTTIGGEHAPTATKTNVLLSMDVNWKKMFPPMPMKRAQPAAICTQTHLVVAGGTSMYNLDVLILNTETLRWSTTCTTPRSPFLADMALCDGFIYLRQSDNVHSCSIKELLVSNKVGCKWTRLADIPARYDASLLAVGDKVMAIGGHEGLGLNPTPVIYHYDKATNLWNVFSELPTPIYSSLTAVTNSNEVIVVGGLYGGEIPSKDVFIGK